MQRGAGGGRPPGGGLPAHRRLSPLGGAGGQRPGLRHFRGGRRGGEGHGELTQIHLWKTAALLRAACLLGLAASPVEATPEQTAAAEAYAREVGIAFQIRDDMLDQESTTQELGKPVGSDADNGKQTFAYMRSHKIGTNLALFYLAESLLHEENSDFETTEHLYQEGITKCFFLPSHLIVSCAQPLDVLKRNQHQFHRRMRRKCINLCKEQRERGQLPDPLLSPVESDGLTMAAIRRLEQIEKQSKQTPSNRNFGVLQEVRADGNGAVLTPSQGLSGVSAMPTAQPAFSILRDEEAEERETTNNVPWTRMDAFAAQSKENERWLRWRAVK